MHTNCTVSRRGHDAHRPHPCRAGPGHLFPDWHMSKKWRGWFWNNHQLPLKNFTSWQSHDKRICCSQPQIVARLGPKKTLTSSPGTLTISPPACQIAKMSKLISRISISIWKFDLTLPTKIDSYLQTERHPVLKCAASWTGSLLTQRLITNCSAKPSLNTLPILSPNKA